MGGKPRPGKYRPATFMQLHPAMADCARELGYALALHGSMVRDFDVVAIPWTDKAVDADELVEALADLVGLTPCREPELKPHGRRAWSLHFLGEGVCWDAKYAGPGTYVDLSVMPRLP